MADGTVYDREALNELRRLADALLPSSSQPACKYELEQLTLTALAAAYTNCSNGSLPILIELIGEWRRRKQFVTEWSNAPEKLMLVVSELSEAMEEYRNIPLIDGKPTFKDSRIEKFSEEIADAFIRIADLCDALGIDLFREVCYKMAKNELRPIKHGKQC